MLRLFRQSRATDSRGGVSFTADGIAVAAVVRGGDGRPRLEHCDFSPADATAENTRLANLARAHELSRTPLCVVVQPQDYQLVLVEAPDVLPAELRAAIRWRLKDVIGFHIDDAVVDVFEIPDQSRRAQAHMTYAVAARSAAIQHYVRTVRSTCRLDAIDIPELCLRNLCMLTPADRGGVALLAADAGSAQLVLVRNGVLYLARRIEWSAGDEDAALDTGLLALEVQRSLDYYESHYDQAPIGDLIVAPLDARFAGLAERLGGETGLRVGLLDLNSLLECRQPLAPEMQARCLLAIGAALRRDARGL